jgi:hypothetical protein
MRLFGAARSLALLLLGGCAESGGGGAGAVEDERAFVPEGLSNTEAEEGGLSLIAFTLERGENGLGLYAAARNDGDIPVCEPGMTTDFVDRAERLVGSAGMTLYGGHFYRIEDGSGAIVSCVPPGEVAMGAALALPESIVPEELAVLRHAFPAFVIANLVSVSGLELREVEAVTRDGGTAYTGMLINQLELGVEDPRVLVFPLNRVGWPLAVASSDAAIILARGQGWSFETSVVIDRGAGYAAFPTASVAY